jgi:hypothetical protein
MRQVMTILLTAVLGSNSRFTLSFSHFDPKLKPSVPHRSSALRRAETALNRSL